MKSITFTDLSKIILSRCLKKFKLNSHKPDILSNDFKRLKERTDQERDERLKAFWIWHQNRTEKNAQAFHDEVSDEIIFLMAQSAKVDEYQQIERK